MIHHFNPVFLARNLKILAVSVVAISIVFVLFRLSIQIPPGTIGNLSLPEFTSDVLSIHCPPSISQDDFSSTAIRCRILSAQKEARASRKSQSKTPEDAVAEYKRRYNRDPPKGFEDWVKFALEHESRIIDDFDQIDRDLQPYRTPEARAVYRKLKEQGGDCSRTTRITIKDHKMSTTEAYMYDPQLKKLVEPFLEKLPDSLFYLSTIDEPRILSTNGPQPESIKFQDRSGQSIEDLVLNSCNEVTPKLSSYNGEYKDVCQSPNPGILHAFIGSPSTVSYTYSLVPILSFGRMSVFRDILVPCPCYASHPIVEEDKIPFLEKKPAVFWRGSSTGGQAKTQTWKYGHRERFVAFIELLQNAANILGATQFFGKSDAWNKKQINLFKDVFDVRMGAYIQCEEKACKDMERILGPSDYQPEDISATYRFLYDIDGNSMSTRFYRLLSRQVVVLKQSWFQEWHDDRLVPWAHYVPVTMGMEELPAVLNFLINDPRGVELSVQIAEAGSSWSREVLREIDMSIYIYRVLLEIADLDSSP